MKRPYFVSLFPYEDIDVRGNLSDLMQKVGRNTGNLLFTCALHRIVRTEAYASGYSFDPKEVAERHDGIIVSAANWLSSSFDMTPLVELIEQTQLPVIIVGIGAQSPNASVIPKLTESTERLVRIASDTSATISVRGDFSAHVLERYGIKNVRVTGCPSLLWHYGAPISVEKKTSIPKKLTLHSTRHDLGFLRQQHTPEHRLNLHLYRVAIRQKHDLVLQSETPDMAAIIGDTVTEAMTRELYEVYGGLEHEIVAKFLSQNGKLFFGVEQWVSYLSQRDFVVGTRIHGCVASILAGTPTLLIAHDSRTEEMAVTLGVPFIRVSDIDIDRGIDWQVLYEMCDVGVFERKYPNYLSGFSEFFKENGLVSNLGAGTSMR
ncbi:polysaccharide pyruvyl transferase family protein [Ensifer sp. Root127]|uniref:polysaccharide pyruvyl transferase family protein n=1 Tax=Ensifer sp. Root127 TaxID=1736440 RepID=UPI0007094340|nr:polysaccharide pyruvyl transferase family protein [Ensifer sp. Root127]KQW61016.1 hypothetical protein ASD03_36745 [Ensifer sp. Root127]